MTECSTTGEGKDVSSAIIPQDNKGLSIYELSRELLGVSAIIYCAAHLRELARQDKLKGSTEELTKRLLGQSFSVTEAVAEQVFMENKEILFKEFGERHVEIYLKAFESLREDRVFDEENAETRIVVFDDENSKSELVYAIALDSKTKNVVVCFRGSATTKDWIIDSKVYLTDVNNPVAEPDSKDQIGIHAGFYEYLYTSGSPASNNGSSGLGVKPKKYEKILKEVSELLEENPGYRLVATGHSLGAALATLFCFIAANDDRIPKPVCTINFASPRAGNTLFQQAFRTLEQQDKIRCLRVVNKEDVIPDMPDRHACGCCVCPAHTFRHVGMELKLYKSRGYKFVYPNTADRRTCRHIRRDCQKCLKQLFTCATLPARNPMDYMHYHSCSTYLTRLERESEELNKLRLVELYEDHLKGKESSQVEVSLTR